MRSTLWLGFITVLAGCLPPSGKEGAVRVAITLSSFRPQCLKVTAIEVEGTNRSEAQLTKKDLAGKSELVVAVFKDRGWKEAIQISVSTFETECTGTPVEVVETTSPFRLSTDAIFDWTVKLKAEDKDLDGFAALANGGTDCLDSDNTVRPGAPESCSTVDRDCDGLTQCADPDCNGQGCDDGDSCTFSDVCQSLTCQGTSYSCNSSNECVANSACDGTGACQYSFRAGESCAGGFCSATGACLNTGPFRYLPPNFAPGNYSPTLEFEVPPNCNVTFNTSGVPEFTSWCESAPKPVPEILTNGNAGELVLLPVKTFRLPSSSSLTLTGDRPVVLAVYDEADIQGAIYANSQRSGANRKGAGANPVSCNESAGADGMSGANGGGGGGGGGNAGAGESGGSAGGAGAGSSGIARPIVLEPLQGGCPGGNGALNLNSRRGNGGGALQISVAGTLTIDSTITVSGGSGGGGFNNTTPRSAGGGGGSGGTLILQGQTVKIQNNARLTANGGAGGGGTNTSTGNDGQDGSLENSATAMGGQGTNGGGSGGRGGALNAAPTSGQSVVERGAGGGGGGVGAIHIMHFSPSVACEETAATLSPAPQRFNCPD